MVEFQFRVMASALVQRGVPVESLISITDLATREHVDVICDFYIDRLGRSSEQLGSLLNFLRPTSVRLLKDAAFADWIGRRIKRLNGGRGRCVQMTEKNRRRLAVFKDPQLVRKLLLLPFKLVKRAEAGEVTGNKAAILVRAAVAIELEIICPIRLQNLSEIDLDRDFVRSLARTRRCTCSSRAAAPRTARTSSSRCRRPRWR